jgi:hypothetical protein
LGVLTIGFIAQRYLGDFLPVLVPLTLVGGLLVARWIAALASRPARRVAWGAAIALVAFSVWVNLGLGLLVQRAYWAPDAETRHSFLSFQQSIDEDLFSARYLSGATRPADDAGTRGELFIVGECEQLLWHDSWVWVDVEPLEDGTTPLCLRLLH